VLIGERIGGWHADQNFRYVDHSSINRDRLMILVKNKNLSDQKKNVSARRARMHMMIVAYKGLVSYCSLSD
jgi:hypothetical protein